MDLLLASGVFAIVFIGLLVFLATRGGDAEQKQSLLRRMARPDEDLDVDITRKGPPRDEGAFAFLYRLNLLRKLEENMWQAGIYMRVSEMLLIVILMFLAGLFVGIAIWRDFLLAMAPAVGLGVLPLFYIRFRRGRRLRAFVQ